MHDATIAQIARRAGVSTGIISHYFKDKNGLLEATMRDITGQLRDAVLSRLHALPNGSAEQRLQAIVGGNFDETQVSSAAMKAWLAFWASSMHQPMLYRLQQVSSRRLLSNLVYEFRRELPREQAQEAGYGLAALIDGLGYFGILRRIVLPLSTAAIATIGLYYAVFFWNDWFNSLIYLKSDQYPVMMFLRNIVNGTMVIGTGSGSAEKTTIAISVKSAVIITSTVPIIVIYPFLQKFFVKGLTIGGVKG